MPQTQPNTSLKSSPKQFPTRELLLYWAAQLGLGFLFSIPNLENIQWLKDLLIPLDSTFPTFKTAFVQSSTPIASKIFLVIWWLVIIPWGLVFAYFWTQGFKPHPNGLNANYATALGLLAASLIMSLMIGSLLSFHDYSYYWMIDKPNSPSRGDFVPALLSSGPQVMSIWLAASSFLIASFVSGIPLILRTIFCKLFKENQ